MDASPPEQFLDSATFPLAAVRMRSLANALFWCPTWNTDSMHTQCLNVVASLACLASFSWSLLVV